MYTLYELNTISFENNLKQDGYKANYIQKNLWKYHYFLTYILHKRRYSTLNDGWVKISVDKLKKLLKQSKMDGKNFWFIDRIRRDLKRWGIIKSKYVTSNLQTRSSRAKILDEVIESGYSEWKPNIVMNTVISEQKLTGIYANIQRSLSLLTIDEKAAIKFTNHAFNTSMSLPAKLEGWKMNNTRVVGEDVKKSWESSIKNIVNGNYEVNVQYETSGRVYTPVTSFPKKLKSFLKINGKSNLVQLDCSCSQPLLFGLYLKQNYKVLADDMNHYINLVQSGEFYGYIKQLLVFYNLPFSDTGFKGEFFAKVFYSKEKKFDKWRSLFHMYFPGVSEAILKAKKVTLGEKKQSKTGKMLTVGGQPEILSKHLSLVESDIMIQGVAKRLYELKVFEFLTIHDAILVPAEHEPLVREIIKEEYEKKGITPTIKTESIN